MNAKGKQLSIYDLFILFLSFYVLIVLLIDASYPLSKDVSDLLQYIDNIICVFFLCDFTYRAIKYRFKYLKWGWIDFISSIPMFDAFRVGRLFRVFRILRLLRGGRSVKKITAIVYKSRARGTFVSAAVIAFVLVTFSAIAILNFENKPTANIKNAADAIWWALTTVTTVGYGDKYPVSFEGRIVSVMLMFVGIGIFGIFTGYIASWFVEEETLKLEEETFKFEKETNIKLDLILEKLERLERPTKEMTETTRETNQ